MYSNIYKNHLIIMKTDKIAPVWFLQFTDNQLVTTQKIQILKNQKPKK
jgi:hypothetical protein